jgi:hypothetical protein
MPSSGHQHIGVYPLSIRNVRRILEFSTCGWKLTHSDSISTLSPLTGGKYDNDRRRWQHSEFFVLGIASTRPGARRHSLCRWSSRDIRNRWRRRNEPDENYIAYAEKRGSFRTVCGHSCALGHAYECIPPHRTVFYAQQKPDDRRWNHQTGSAGRHEWLRQPSEAALDILRSSVLTRMILALARQGFSSVAAREAEGILWTQKQRITWTPTCVL